MSEPPIIGNTLYWKQRAEALQADKDRLEAALMFYAQKTNWKGVHIPEEGGFGYKTPGTAEYDKGRIARQVLSGSPPPICETDKARLEAALRDLVNALDKGVERSVLVHCEDLPGGGSILKAARQALSSDDTGLREAERAVVEAAMGWYHDRIRGIHTESHIRKACDNYARLREKGDG